MGQSISPRSPISGGLYLQWWPSLARGLSGSGNHTSCCPSSLGVSTALSAAATPEGFGAPVGPP